MSNVKLDSNECAAEACILAGDEQVTVDVVSRDGVNCVSFPGKLFDSLPGLFVGSVPVLDGEVIETCPNLCQHMEQTMLTSASPVPASDSASPWSSPSSPLALLSSSSSAKKLSIL